MTCCSRCGKGRAGKPFQIFLEYYNNLDVNPFVEAVEKMQVFYKDIGIDFLKECLSIPGVARKFLFQDRPTFSLFGLEDVDRYKTIKKNIVGGPASFSPDTMRLGKLVSEKTNCVRILWGMTVMLCICGP